MDLSVRKDSTSEAAEKKSLSFSVERLLKSSVENEVKNSQNAVVSTLTNSSLAMSLPIRPLVTHPNPPNPAAGSLSLLQSLYVPNIYSHHQGKLKNLLHFLLLFLSDFDRNLIKVFTGFGRILVDFKWRFGSVSIKFQSHFDAVEFW